MDVERCVALHNEILRSSWISSGREPDLLESACHTWFDTFGDEAEAVRPNLAPDLVTFLQRARVIYDPETGVHLNFFYWVQNLASPDFMFEHTEDLADDEDDGRYLVLYAMSNFTGHFCGLLYDQVQHLCIISPTIYEIEDALERRVWYPLETALEYWLSQIRKGAIAALPEVEDRNYGNERFEPWEFVPYTDALLDENITAFNRLVEAIEARMPPPASPTSPTEIVYGLVDEITLQNLNLPQRFGYEFVRRVRRPRFQMIAPGLEVLGPSTFVDQPFGSFLYPGTVQIPPLLLFRFKANYTDNTMPNNRTGEPIAQLFPRHSRITTYPAGLYLRPSSTISAEDECLFLLPFGIGANGYARRSDGSKFGSRRTPADSCFDLYRPGYQPFEQHHEHSLRDVLENWRGLVESGVWQVDENGVAGGIDVWREADSKERWTHYVIPIPYSGTERVS